MQQIDRNISMIKLNININNINTSLLIIIIFMGRYEFV